MAYFIRFIHYKTTKYTFYNFFLFYDVFYMFPTPGFIFRKTVVYTVMVQYVLHASVQAVL